MTAVSDRPDRDKFFFDAGRWESQQLLDLVIIRGPDPWYTRQEAAVYAQVHPHTIDEWERNGLRSVGQGKLKRYRRSWLDEYIERMGADD